MLEKRKSAIDNKINFGALLTDLSKAFDCLPYYLLFAKLNAYGFSLPVLRLTQIYLSNRKQKTKIKLRIQFMGRNFVWGTSRINFGTSFV